MIVIIPMMYPPTSGSPGPIAYNGPHRGTLLTMAQIKEQLFPALYVAPAARKSIIPDAGPKQ